MKSILSKWYNEPTTAPFADGNIKLYYRAFMHTTYKESEKTMKKIIIDNVTSMDNSKKIQLTAYHKNKKTLNLLMKNHPKPTEDPLKQSKVVYCFLCSIQGCLGIYIGMTTMRLSKKISCHVQEGAIYKHLSASHNLIKSN